MSYPTYKDSGGNVRSIETLNGSAAGSNADPDQNKSYVAGVTVADAALTEPPLACGGRASAAEPTAVSADGDKVATWHDLFGRQGVWTPGDVLSVTPVIDTNIYAAGDAVGGVQTLTNAVRVSGGVGVLDTLSIIDADNEKANLTILFFESNPAAATVANNAAFVWSTDLAKYIGKINVVTADYESINSKAVATLRGLGLRLKASGSRNLYAVVVLTSGTPTYSAAGDLTFRYGFAQN